jgi:hypothetical protein
MLQLVTEIVLIEQDHDSDDTWNPVRAVVEYVNGLADRYFYLQELPSKAVQSYFADYYMAQVLNGNIDQFVWNSRWRPLIIESVAAALEAMGLQDQAILFDEVRRFVERDERWLGAFLSTTYFSPDAAPFVEELSEIGGGFIERFFAHPDGHDVGSAQIASANMAWIASWPDVTWIPMERFQHELDRLARVIPDLAARKLKAEEDRPWQNKRIDEVIARSGQELVRLTGVEPAKSAAGVSGELWHMLTDRGHHRVMFAKGEAIMLPGDRDEIIARVPAPEAVPPHD